MKTATRQAISMLLHADGSIPADRLAAAFDVLEGRSSAREAGPAAADRDWLTCREACEFLRCSRTLLWRIETDGRITARRIGGKKKLYSRAELAAAVQGG